MYRQLLSVVVQLGVLSAEKSMYTLSLWIWVSVKRRTQINFGCSMSAALTSRLWRARSRGYLEIVAVCGVRLTVLPLSRQSQRSQTEAVTFLANHDDSRALYAIPGTPSAAVSGWPGLLCDWRCVSH